MLRVYIYIHTHINTHLNRYHIVHCPRGLLRAKCSSISVNTRGEVVVQIQEEVCSACSCSVIDKFYSTNRNIPRLLLYGVGDRLLLALDNLSLCVLSKCTLSGRGGGGEGVGDRI